MKSLIQHFSHQVVVRRCVCVCVCVFVLAVVWKALLRRVLKDSIIECRAQCPNAMPCSAPCVVLEVRFCFCESGRHILCRRVGMGAKVGIPVAVFEARQTSVCPRSDSQNLLGS